MKVVLDEGAYRPTRAHEWDAGLDLRTPKRFVLHQHDSAVIDTGVHVEIPIGYVGILKAKSGLNVKHDITGTGDDRRRIHRLDPGEALQPRLYGLCVPAWR